MTIAAGGSVASAFGNIGQFAGSEGSVTVTGTGSSWTNAGILEIGKSNTASTLTIEDGAAVANTSGTIWASEAGNSVTVTGTDSTWTNSGNLYVNYYGTDTATGTLTVTDGAQVSARALYASLDDLLGNGVIQAKGAVLDGVDLTFDGSHGLQQTIAFGVGGQFQLDVDNVTKGDLGAGYQGTGSLTIAEGVAVTSPTGRLGVNAGSSGSATVTGAGSGWTSNALYVGEAGKGELTIAAGGSVTSGSAYISGDESRVTVTGDDSILDVGALYVGYTGKGELTIAAGGSVTSETGYIGAEINDIISGQREGSVTVTGEGSTWNITGSEGLYVGGARGVGISTGTLTVADGAEVSTRTLHASLNNLAGDGVILAKGAVLDDTTLVFNASNGLEQTISFGSGGELRLDLSGPQKGALGAGHQGTGALTIAGGVAVESATGVLGDLLGSAGSATVTGTGSTWTTGELMVGRFGAGELTIQSGGAVITGAGLIGDFGGEGSVTVTGSGSTWTTTDLYVGYAGTGELLISAGGDVTSGGANIGWQGGSAGNVTVTGTGSIWTNTGYLALGDGGSGHNTLTVADGALVMVDGAFLIDGVNSFLQLDGGYIAWLGNHTTDIFNLLEGGSIQMWNGSDWINASDTAGLAFDYFTTDADALTFSGYGNLGGYTLLTATAVPEPSTYAAILGVVALGFVAWRRRVAGAA